MRMQSGRRMDADEVPVTSFSDIAFLLIIFFILVTSLQQFMGFKADIPAGEKSAQEAKEEMPTLKLHEGSITYNDETIPLTEVRKRLLELELAAKEGAEKIVILEASGSVPYQQYFEVMAAISRAGGVVGIIEEQEGQ